MPGLILKIGADVKEATTALKEVVVEAKTTGKEVERSFSQSTLPLTTGIKATSQSVKALTPQISSLGDTIETLRAKALAKQSFILVEKDITKVAALNKEVEILIAEITRLSNVGKVGFDSLGIAIKAPVSQLAKLQNQLKNFKAGLLTTQSPESFARLNRAIEVTQTRITTLGRAGKVGFDQLGNAIPPVVSGLSNVATGASKAFSFLRQAAFILPGIGIAGLIGGLSNLVVGLFETKDALNSVELASIKLNDQLEAMSRSLKSLEGDLDFLRDVAKLRDQLAGKEGGVIDLLDLKRQQENDKILIDQVDNSIKILQAKTKQFKDGIEALNRASRIDVKFDSEGLIPESFFKDENEKNKSFLSDFNSVTKELNKLNSERVKIMQDAIKTELQIGIQENENQEEADKKAEELRKKRLADYEKFINSTISKAKELSSFLEKRGILNIGAGFNIDPRKSQLENFDQAKRFISDAVSAKFGFLQVRTPLSIEFAQATIKTLDIQGIKFQILPTTDAEKLRKELEDSIKGMTPSISAQFAKMDADAAAALTKIEKNAQATANIINGALTPAFDNLFNAIQAGENPLKAFFQGLGQAVLQLIQKLIQAAITAAILAAIIPGGGAGGFGAQFAKLFGFSGFSGGGLVSGPTLGMIGEGSGTSLSNPEVIAPLDQLKSMLSDLNVGNQRVQVAVTGRLRGRDMALQNARTSRSQRRLGG